MIDYTELDSAVKTSIKTMLTTSMAEYNAAKNPGDILMLDVVIGGSFAYGKGVYGSSDLDVFAMVDNVITSTKEARKKLKKSFYDNYYDVASVIRMYLDVHIMSLPFIREGAKISKQSVAGDSWGYSLVFDKFYKKITDTSYIAESFSKS